MTPPSAAAAPAVRPARTANPARPRPRKAPAPAGRRPRAAAPAQRPVRAIWLAEAFARQRLLDRLIRGRAWIGLLAFALIGIVAMQLWVLKLNAGIGRAVEHAGLLERENTALSIEDSEASSGDRVEQLAAAQDMVAAAPGAQRFLRSRGAEDTRLAAATLAHPVTPPASSATGAGEGAASAGSATTSTAGSATSGVTGEASSSTTSGAPVSNTETSSTSQAASSPTAVTGASTGATTEASRAAAGTQTQAPRPAEVPHTTVNQGAAGSGGATTPTEAAGAPTAAGGVGVGSGG